MAAPELDLVVELRVPRLLDLVEAGAILGCSPRTVRRRIAKGLIPAVLEEGRLMVRGDELRAYIDSLTRPAGSTMRARRRQPGSPYGRLA